MMASRASIADHVEQLQKSGASLAMVLLVLTLQNADEFGVWDVTDRPGYLRALTGEAEEKAASEVPEIRKAVEHLKAAGAFAEHATVYRPIVVMPRHVLARGVGEGLEDRRAGGHLPRVEVIEEGAA
ncbi:hypothetical protein BH708_03900 [Brachybacterium sp. P6-10-X1]|uniref:hypothetical protein n=1 Tax=Brachybacterium sp. P6-10-X1 TaxID=1903186 RepID=UPI000971A73F|nr:hypothetical protein [Brachybacterium sp. P6-10-X1]APX32012.1 hypothetical protein BH708_03900 [Brachybacterium sp. P6-10-X1]